MYIVEANTTITPKLIKEVIESNLQTKVSKYDILDRYYMGRHSILERHIEHSSINNKVVVNHAKYITNINVGYLLGNPVEYQVTSDKIDIQPILDAYAKQGIATIDAQIGKIASKFGHAYDYTYAIQENEKAVLKTKPIDPRNCQVVYDDTFEHNKLFAIIYKTKKAKLIKQDGIEDDYYDVRVITDNEIQTYEDEKLERYTSEKHYLKKVPVNEYFNNDEIMGDYQDVVSLIDAYNILQSDRINDKQQLVEAILVLKGVNLTDSQKRDLKTFRTLSLPKDATADFLIKQLDETNLDKLREVIKDDILTIAMTPNFSDANFIGNSSGVAIKYKLIAFEQNVKVKERYFEKGLLDRFNLYVNLLNFKNDSKLAGFDPSMLDVRFKRNLPQNDLETSEMILNLNGTASKETLLSQLSFVKDAKKEVEWAKEEAKANSIEDEEGFGRDQSGEEEDEDDPISNAIRRQAEKLAQDE
jgi:SPP1 family phage portal protein